MRRSRPGRVWVFVALVAPLLLISVKAASAGASLGALGHQGRWLTDTQGRVVIVRGLQEWGPNGSLAGPLPFGHRLPGALGYDADDAQFLAANGFNVMRLSLSYWEYAPGRYDDGYLDGFAAFIRQLDAAGVYSLVDLQQAIYGPHFSGGEGFPEWMTLTDGLPNQPDSGYPSSYYSNPSENRAWDNFWANKPASDGVGLQDHVAAGWRHLAQRFAAVPGILGYDLLNEPWPGTPWQTCAGLTGCAPGGFDEASLAPFTAHVLRAIRQADQTRLVVYEPNLEFDFSPDTRITPPGDAHAVFGFHDYCLGGAVPGGAESDSCAMPEDQVLKNAVAYAQRSGDALMLGEWGGQSGPLDTARIASLADQYMLPWSNWAYGAVVRDPKLPPTGANVDTAKLKLLVRPYPQRTAGTPIAWSYDPTTRGFSFDYAAVAPDGRPAPGAPTEVFIPALQYPNGYHVSVSGAAVTSSPTAGLLSLCNLPGATRVSVRVTPDPSGSTDAPTTSSATASCPSPQQSASSESSTSLTPVGAPVTIGRAGTTVTAAGGLQVRTPSTRRCANRHRFTIHLTRRPGLRVRSAVVIFRGRRIRLHFGRRLTTALRLHHVPASTFHIQIVVRYHARGRDYTLRVTRAYRPCIRRRSAALP
ncbi:MAG TPA: cellulase family glycosylhydrolase [Solirubrobacteraceae bacterium]|nr:cellulase family glycosylhydrolase [Solirubrobacteraceae bacterium]